MVLDESGRTQSAKRRAVEYTDCIAAKRQDPPPPKECPGYEIKTSDGEAPA